MEPQKTAFLLLHPSTTVLFLPAHTLAGSTPKLGYTPIAGFRQRAAIGRTKFSGWIAKSERAILLYRSWFKNAPEALTCTRSRFRNTARSRLHI